MAAKLRDKKKRIKTKLKPVKKKKDSVELAQPTDKKKKTLLWKLTWVKVNRIHLHMKIAGD